MSRRELALEAGSPKIRMRLGEAIEKFSVLIKDRDYMKEIYECSAFEVAIVCEYYFEDSGNKKSGFIIAYDKEDDLVLDIDYLKGDKVTALRTMTPERMKSVEFESLGLCEILYRDPYVIPGQFMLLMRVGVEEWMIDACLNQ